MPRYVSRPIAYDDDGWWMDEGNPRSLMVHEDEREPQPTGLLDQHGNELYRVEDRHPIGFDLTPRRARMKKGKGKGKGGC